MRFSWGRKRDTNEKEIFVFIIFVPFHCDDWIMWAMV